MTYEVIILGHLHMPLYFIGTFTEYPYLYFYYNKLYCPLSFSDSIIPVTVSPVVKAEQSIN